MTSITSKIGIAVLLAVCLTLAATPAMADSNQLTLTAWTVRGSLTASTSSTCGATSCAIMPVSAIVNGVAWQVTGTLY